MLEEVVHNSNFHTLYHWTSWRDSACATAGPTAKVNMSLRLRGPSDLDNVFQQHFDDIRQLMETASKHERIRIEK